MINITEYAESLFKTPLAPHMRGESSRTMVVSGHEDRSHRLLMSVGESGGLRVMSRTNAEDAVYASCRFYTDRGAHNVWISHMPPPPGCHVWCRHASEGTREEFAKANADRATHGLVWVAVIDVASFSLNGTFHLLSGPDDVIRSFNRETDLYAHIVDGFARAL